MSVTFGEQLSFPWPAPASRGTNTGAPSTWLSITPQMRERSGSKWVDPGGQLTLFTFKPDTVVRTLPPGERRLT